MATLPVASGTHRVVTATRPVGTATHHVDMVS